MLPAILAKIGIPVLIEAVKEGLGRLSSPTAKAAKDALDGVSRTIERGETSIDELKEANRHLEKLEEIKGAENAKIIAEVNASLRTEVASSDPYVRRMRPTFGYIMAVTWGAQMLSVAYTIIAEPEKAGTVISAIGNLGTIWTVGLSVLGIYVYKRSQEKLGN